MWSAVAAIVAILLAFRFTTGPTLAPASFDLPPLPVLKSNHRLVSAEHIPLSSPESFVFQDNKLITGLVNGQIVSLDLNTLKVELVTYTGDRLCHNTSHAQEPSCGRPLGLRLVQDTLYVCDAYKGLLSVNLRSDQPRPTVLVTSVNQKPLVFANDLDVSSTGMIYFTDSSARYERRDVILEVLEGSATGRLLAYNPATGTTSQLLESLPFPNGVTLSHDGAEVLVALTTRAQVLAYNIETGVTRTFAENLPGNPDNIRRTKTGSYYIGCSTKRSQPFSLMDAASTWPTVRMLAAKLLPTSLILALIPAYGVVVEIDATGKVIDTLQDPTGRTPWISESDEHDGYLYFGSWKNEFLARVPLQ